MADDTSPAQTRLNARGNGVGNFNGGGKVLTGGDKEFYKRNGRWHVRNRPQTTKDRNAVAREGKDPNATGGKGVDTKKTIKLGSAKTKEVGVYNKKGTLAKGAAGELGGSAKALTAQGQAQANINLKDGVEIQGDIGAKGVLVGGELKYKAPALNLSVFGESCSVQFAIVASAEAAAEVKGSLAAKVTGKEAGLSIGGDAFAGGKAGIKAELKLMWKPKGGKAQDLIGGSVSAEGWAGIGIGGKAQIGLLPKIKANAYFAACAGFGGKVGAEIWMHAINAAKLGWVLISKGYKNAVDGLKKYGPAIANWISSSARGAYASLKRHISSFMAWMNADDAAQAVFKSGYYKYLTPGERGQLIKDMQSGWTGEGQQDAILGILKDAAKQGDLAQVVSSCAGKADGILGDLDGAQDTAARRLFRQHGISY